MNRYIHTSGTKEDYVGYVSTKSGIVVATGFSRIVHGGRGAYVEFSDKQINQVNLEIPPDQLWRLNKEYTDKIYYTEWRTKDKIKVYHQKRTVDYADYKPGMWYISPRDLQDFVIEGRYTI